jgi:hypothetical protein
MRIAILRRNAYSAGSRGLLPEQNFGADIPDTGSRIRNRVNGKAGDEWHEPHDRVKDAGPGVKARRLMVGILSGFGSARKVCGQWLRTFRGRKGFKAVFSDAPMQVQDDTQPQALDGGCC